MSGKVFVILFFFLFTVTVAGEKIFTGNFRVDLMSSAQDSVGQVEEFPEKDGFRQNPFMNGLYSLAIPGVGQVRSEQYTKAGIFFTADVALIVYAIVSDNNGDKKTKEFQAYAEAHWSAERYALWIRNHGADYQDLNNSNSPGNTAIDIQRVRNHDFSEVNAWESAIHKIGFSHQLPAYQSQQYYELIGKYHQYKFGWDTYEVDGFGVPVSDNGNYDNLLKSEKQFKDYAVERGKANDYYYAASFAASALVINHVISAVDAFFSTKSYNKEISATFQVTPVDGIDGKRLLSEVQIHIPF